MAEYLLGISHNEQDRGNSGISSSNKILIDGHEFTAIKSTNLTQEATVCTRRVESQSEITDHVIENPVVFDFEIELFDVDEEYEVLNTLYKEKTPFALTTHRGVFDNMIVTKLSDIKAQQSTDTTSASLTVKQIRIGTSETIIINTSALETTVTTQAEDSFPGSNTLQFTVMEVIPQSLPEKEENTPALEHCDVMVKQLDALRSMNRMVPKV